MMMAGEIQTQKHRLVQTAGTLKIILYIKSSLARLIMVLACKSESST